MRTRTKFSTSSLLTYTFIAVLFLVASQVDLNKLTTAAMENQQASTESFIAAALR